MNLYLTRKWFTPDSTIGELLIGDDFECLTLEDVVREGPKVYGKTAIPEGIYDVIITPSARFKRDMPLICAVPGFSGVRIHSGNTADDTEGCILVGQTRGKDWIGHSRKAFDLLFAKIRTAKAAGIPITITVRSEAANQTEYIA